MTVRGEERGEMEEREHINEREMEREVMIMCRIGE